MVGVGLNYRKHSTDPAVSSTGPLRKSAESDPPLRGVLSPLDPCLLLRDAQILRVGDHQNPTVVGRCERHRVTEVRVVGVLLNVGLTSVATVVVGEQGVGRVHWLVATEQIIPWKGPECDPLTLKQI